MRQMTAREVMNRKIIAVRDFWSVGKLASFLFEKSISGAPVLDSNGVLVGVVSLMDIARFESEQHKVMIGKESHDFFAQAGKPALLPEHLRAMQTSKSEETRVADIMMRAIFKVSPVASVQSIARMMIESRIHRVLVVDERRGDELLGIVTTIDLLQVIRDLPAAPHEPEN